MKNFAFVILLSVFCCFTVDARTSLNEAVDFETKDCNGNYIHLFEILDGGQYVLIDFFYSNCGSCVSSIPNVVEAHKILGCNASDIFFIGISRYDNDSSCLKWIERFNIESPIISAVEGNGARIINSFGISGYPTILIAPNRSIVIQDIYPIENANIIVDTVAYYGVNPHDCPPAGPANIDFVLNFNVVELTWEAPESKAVVGYNVYKDNELIAENITETEFSDESEGGTYKYCVTAVYEDSESAKECIYVEVIFCDDEISLGQAISLKQYGVRLVWLGHFSNLHSGEFLYYNVYRDDNIIATTDNNEYFDKDPPNSFPIYVVSAVYSDGCEAFSNEIEGHPTIYGINENKSDVTIYPNPTTDYINIKLNDESLYNQYVEIYNITGNLLIKQKLSNTQINVSKLARGIYIINVNNTIKKFIKE